MRILSFILGILMVSFFLVAANAAPKIAVIDTGFSAQAKDAVKLCKTGHYDFVNNEKKVGVDEYGHGTVVSAIMSQASKKKYRCMLVYKVIGFFGTNDVTKDIGRAIMHAVSNGAKVINISMGGPGISYRNKRIINAALKRGVKFFVAAGNDNVNMDKVCNYYPACYNLDNTNFHVVGSMNALMQKSSYSNYGAKVNTWIFGEPIINGRIFYGTSFASPHAAGLYLLRKEK